MEERRQDMLVKSNIHYSQPLIRQNSSNKVTSDDKKRDETAYHSHLNEDQCHRFKMVNGDEELLVDMEIDAEDGEDTLVEAGEITEAGYVCGEFGGRKGISQPINSILNQLPEPVIAQVFEYVDQFDLINLSLVCKSFNFAAISRLYKRVTVILDGEFPIRYKDNSRLFIKENGIKYMDTTLILKPKSLVSFLDVIHTNEEIVNKIKFFIFDKCNGSNVDRQPIGTIQDNLIDFFGAKSSEMNFLHITFAEYVSGFDKLTQFLSNENIRNKIFKLFVVNLNSLHSPKVPQGLTNLFLMLNEMELMGIEKIDLSCAPFEFFNSLFTLTCSTNSQLGLGVLQKLRLVNDTLKLNLRGLTVFHCHRDKLDFDDEFSDSLATTQHNYTTNDAFSEYIDQLDKRLDFGVIHDKINLTSLSNLYLKVDCNEHGNSSCDCFSKFFNDFTKYSIEHDGLPNLISFELELFPNLEWLRPHQILESKLTPLSGFITSLSNLKRLSMDLSTPGFKMFDNSMGMTSFILNRLNERLMEAFFLRFLTFNDDRSRFNLKTLQLPDFLTSFIYYKPDFYESLLHTCQCWGCQKVLDQLKEKFHPLIEEDEEEDDLQSTFYILIGFILGKLQADREICVPIKQKTFNYRNYPIYKGTPHTLHSHFHKNSKKCNCEVEADPSGKKRLNIDNLVTTYIIHQLKPLVKFLLQFFWRLETLMIHGIYFDVKSGEAIYDEGEYTEEFLGEGGEAEGPFGRFRK